MIQPTGIGPKSRAGLSQVLRETKGTITPDQVTTILKINPNQAAVLLSRWVKNGWLYRVRRGLYVPVPVESSSAEPALEEPWLIAQKVFSPSYIGGWSAGEYWDLTEQIFRSIVVITGKPRQAKKQSMGGTDFFVVSSHYNDLFGIKQIWKGSHKFRISDPTRTVVDMLDRPEVGAGISMVNEFLQNYYHSKYVNEDLLFEYAQKLGNKTILKRLGFLTERLYPSKQSFLEKCHKRISKGYAQLDPHQKSVLLSTKWKLWIPKAWKVADDY